MQEALEFNGPAFRVLGVEVVNPEFGIFSGRGMGLFFKLFIHTVHTVLFRIKKGDGAP